MKTELSNPIYQEALGINRKIQFITKGYHSNGSFNLAHKIKDDTLRLCNALDQGVSARFGHTFEQYYSSALEEIDLLLEHIRIANCARMIRGGFPKELNTSLLVLRAKIVFVLELYQVDMKLDYKTVSTWARAKVNEV